MSLPHYKKYGWKADILCVGADYDEGVKDNYLEKTVPDNINIYRCKSIPKHISKLFGIRGVQWRSLYHLYILGCKLIKKNRYDLVFFSSTVFPTFIFGTIWKKRFKIPYVLDFQDPWLNNYEYKKPPGGKLKYFLSKSLARIFEPIVVKNAKHLFFVSELYPDIYNQRYSLDGYSYSVIPFGFSKNDYDLLDCLKTENDIFEKESGKSNWVYIGRAGEDFHFALDIFFEAIRNDIDEGRNNWFNVNLHFIGTSYAEKGRAVETVKPIARKYDLQNIVFEYTGRIPFHESLKVLSESNVVMMFGSLDKSYSPSKIYPYAYLKKPMFSLLHKSGAAFKVLENMKSRFLTGFDPDGDKEILLLEIKNSFDRIFNEKNKDNLIDKSELNKFESSELAKVQCNIFNNCINV